MSLSTNFNAVNNQIDDISFGVLRTNPKLTTNVKLVVNSMGSLYMDSMEANSALSNTSFNKGCCSNNSLTLFIKLLSASCTISFLYVKSDSTKSNSFINFFISSCFNLFIDSSIFVIDMSGKYRSF